MKLKDDFFKVTDSCQTATGADYTIALNPEHFIYRAHFPGNPITPGVCIIQIVKELSKEILNCELFLEKLNNVKFLNIINPLENKEVTFSVSIASNEDGEHKIGAIVYHGGNQFAKLSLGMRTK